VAAARQVIRSMLNAGLVEEAPAATGDARYTWRTGDDGSALVVQMTQLGLARIREAADIVTDPRLT
jgi:hypothetical protein